MIGRMEACPWGQARAGRRRGSARKVAGGQGKVASGQGKVAGFVSICMFCVFHIGLNGIKSRGGWPTWPWQPVAAPAVASGPATERVTEELHQKDYVKSYHWTQQKHTPCTYISCFVFCILLRGWMLTDGKLPAPCDCAVLLHPRYESCGDDH